MPNNEEKKFNSLQEYLDEVKKMRNFSLENGVPYKSHLKEIKDNTTYSMQIPSLDFVYDVEGIEAIDTYVFDMENPKYIMFTLNRLADTLELYGEKLGEFTDTKTVAKAYQHLIGTEAIIQQHLYKGYPKYEVLSTEKTGLNI